MLKKVTFLQIYKYISNYWFSYFSFSQQMYSFILFLFNGKQFLCFEFCSGTLDLALKPFFFINFISAYGQFYRKCLFSFSILKRQILELIWKSRKMAFLKSHLVCNGKMLMAIKQDWTLLILKIAVNFTQLVTCGSLLELKNVTRMLQVKINIRKWKQNISCCLQSLQSCHSNSTISSLEWKINK